MDFGTKNTILSLLLSRLVTFDWILVRCWIRFEALENYDLENGQVYCLVCKPIRFKMSWKIFYSHVKLAKHSLLLRWSRAEVLSIILFCHQDCSNTHTITYQYKILFILEDIRWSVHWLNFPFFSVPNNYSRDPYCVRLQYEII